MKTNLILLVTALVFISGEGYCCLNHIQTSGPTDQLPSHCTGMVFPSFGLLGLESSGFLIGDACRPGANRSILVSTVKTFQQPSWNGLWSALKNRKSKGDVAGVLSLIFGLLAVTSGIIALTIATPLVAVILSFLMAVFGIVLGIKSMKKNDLQFKNVISLLHSNPVALGLLLGNDSLKKKKKGCLIIGIIVVLLFLIILILAATLDFSIGSFW